MKSSIPAKLFGLLLTLTFPASLHAHDNHRTTRRFSTRSRQHRRRRHTHQQCTRHLPSLARTHTY